jgi:hypothetical protein
MSRPPLPPFTRETAAQKARMAEDAWNSPACGQRAEIFQLSTYLSGVPAAAAEPRASCFITALKGGSASRGAVRWSIHLLVRLVIAATCNSPAAALGAAHVLHAADVTLRDGHSLAVRWREARSNSQPETTGCASGGKSGLAAQQEGAFQPNETEEFGRQ